MAHRKRDDDQPFGSDSFLDVVTNVVGILIILVIVVGLRAQNAPAHGGTVLAGAVDLAPLMSQHDTLEREVLRLTDEVHTVDQQATASGAQREAVAVLVAQLERDLASRRGALNAERQVAFDAQRELAAGQARLQELSRAIDAARQASSAPLKIESYPTPISRSVEGQEAHFQLRAGHVQHIRLDELLDLFKAEANRRIYKLRDQRELSGTIGPVDGFRLRYLLERVDVADGGGRVGSFAQLVRWELLPNSDSLGETIDEALAEDSAFRAALGRLNPRKHTVTLWVYPDSFAEFRALKKRLFEAGFATAGRPLPEGEPIGGSPQGSKSLAQ